MPLRKPLYPAERAAPPTVVAVTGATGYMAGPIVARLLAAGHTVHGTVRDPEAPKCDHLRAMEGAGERLKLFKADLTDPASFDAPLAGATIVFHTASPVVMTPPKGRERELLIDPAVRGTEAVLAAATRAGTVTRVVMTSSISALTSKVSEGGPDKVWSEADWNESANEDYLPYHASKTAAERRAYEMEAAQTRWTLATMLPGIVQGPPPGPTECDSVDMMRRLLNGGILRSVPPASSGFVDVDDVAAAHALAGVVPAARGRYILVSESMSVLAYVRLLRPEFAHRKLPLVQSRMFIVKFIMCVLGRRGGHAAYDLVASLVARVPPRYDTSKATTELGLDWIPLKRTAVDMATCMVAMKMTVPLVREGGGLGR